VGDAVAGETGNRNWPVFQRAEAAADAERFFERHAGSLGTTSISTRYFVERLQNGAVLP